MGLKKTYPPLYSTHDEGHDSVGYLATIETSSISNTISISQRRVDSNDKQIVMFNQDDAKELLVILQDIVNHLA